MARKARRIEHKGYVVLQDAYNHHVMILKDKKMVMHSQCDSKKNDDELREMVDNYLTLMEMIVPANEPEDKQHSGLIEED